MRVTIHQPEFAPWLGFFHKVSQADRLILLDDAQFRKNYFQNRNRIRIREGATWITVPVEKHPILTPIHEIRIAWGARPQWARGINRALLHSYRRAPYFDEIFGEWSKLLAGVGEMLSRMNVPILLWMLKRFGLTQEVLLSSTLQIDSRGSQRILELCLGVGATTYVSGVSGRDYLELDAFQRAGIRVEFQEFHHPVYPQLHPGFLPQISALEALFLFGPSCRRLIQPDWAERLETVFA